MDNIEEIGDGEVINDEEFVGPYPGVIVADNSEMDYWVYEVTQATLDLNTLLVMIFYLLNLFDVIILLKKYNGMTMLFFFICR
jgi:hypothetical protein